MSNSVDQRIVEMRFDNGQFEKGIEESLESLNKLERGLKNSGSKGTFDKMGEEMKKFSLSPMEKAITGVEGKFRALGVAGATVVASITSSLLDTGKAAIKTLAQVLTQRDAVRSGFNEYELKMGSIQTILSGTGESVENVSKYLNELNTYADKTIYSFSDMTSNIGKFTNAGVDLKSAVKAIQGVSNVAALSGATTNQASNAMYNFAQALSSGSVRLIDWKSIENANMATVAFKEQLIETAVAVGTLKKTNDGMYKSMKKGAKAFSATTGFNDTLQEQWLTTDVLIQTLGRYADESTDVGKKAFAAAQDVKTLTQLIDTLKEAMGSGWAQTWELLIGNFEEAKELWTKVSNLISPIIEESAEARNSLLEEWSELGGRDMVIEGLFNAFHGLWGIVLAVRDALESVFPKPTVDQLMWFSEKIQEIGQAINEFFSYVGWKEVRRLPTGEGEETVSETGDAEVSVDTKVAGKSIEKFDRVLKKGARGDDVKKYQEMLRELGYDVGEVDGIFGEKTRKALIQFQKDNELVADGIFGQKSFEALTGKFSENGEKEAGGIETVTTEYHKLGNVLTNVSNIFKGLFAAVHLVLGVFKFLGGVGREILGVFQPLIDVIVVICSKIGEWIFGLDQSVTEGGKFNGWLQSLHEFLTPLRDLFTNVADAIMNFFGFGDEAEEAGDKTEEATDKISTLPELWERITSGIQNSTIWQTFSNIFARIREAIEPILPIFRQFYDDAKAYLGDKFQSVLGWLGENVPSAINSLGEFFSGFLTNHVLPFIQNLPTHIEKIRGFIDQVVEFFSGLWNGIDVSGSFGGLGEKLQGFIQPIVDFIRGIFTTIGELFTPSASAEEGDVLASLTPLQNIAQPIQQVVDTVHEITQPIEEVSDTVAGVEKTSEKTPIGEILSGIFERIGGWLKDGPDLLPSIGMIATIIVSIKSIMGIVNAIKSVSNTVGGLTGIMSSVSGLMNNVSGFVSDLRNRMFHPQEPPPKKTTFPEIIKALAIAIATLVAALYVLGNMDIDTLKQGGIALGAIILALMVVISMLNKYSKGMSADQAKGLAAMAKNIIAMTIGITVLVAAIAIFGGMKPKRIITGTILIIGVMAALTLMIKSIAKSGDTTIKLSGLISMAIAVGILTGVVAVLGNMNTGAMIQGLIGLTMVMGVLKKTIVAINRSTGGTVKYSGLIGLSVAVRILVGVVKAIAKIKVTSFIKGVIGLNVLMGILKSFIKNVNKTTGSNTIQYSGLVGLSVAIGILAGIVALVGHLKMKTAIKGILVLIGIMEALALFLKTAGHPGIDAKSSIGVLISALSIIPLVIAFAVALVIVQFIDFKKVAAFCLGMAAIMAAFGYMLKSMTGEHNTLKGNIVNSLLTVIAISSLLLVVSYALQAVKDIPAGVIIAFLGGLAAVIAAMGFVFKSVRKVKLRAAVPLLTQAIGVIAIMLALSYALGQIQSVPVSVILSFTAGMTAIILAMALMLKCLKGNNWSSGIGALLALIGIVGVVMGLASALLMVQDIKAGTMISFALSISLIVAAMSLMLKSTAGLDWKSGVGSLISMMGLILYMVAFAAVVRMVQDIDPFTMIEFALAMSMTMKGMAKALAGSRGLNRESGLGSLITIAALTAFMLAFAGALHIAESIDPKVMLTFAVSLAAMFKAMARVLASTKGLKKKNALSGIIVLGVIAALMLEFTLLIGTIRDVDPGVILSFGIGMTAALFGMAKMLGAMKNVKFKKGAALISLILIAGLLAEFAFALRSVSNIDPGVILSFTLGMAGVFAGFGVMIKLLSSSKKFNVKKALASLGGTLSVVVLLAAFSIALSKVKDVKPSVIISLAGALSGIMLSLGGFFLMSGAAGVGGILTGLLGILGIVAVISLIITAFAALSKIPGFQDFMNSGAASIGEIIGNFIGSLKGASKAAEIKQLSKGVSNLPDATVDEGKLDSMLGVAQKIADFEEGLPKKTVGERIVDFITGSPLKNLTSDMVTFGEGFNNFATIIGTLDVPETETAETLGTKVEYAINIAKKLADFSSYLEGDDPVNQDAIDKVIGFLQQSPLSKFTEGMTDFGTGFMAFKDTISPLDVPAEGEADELGKKVEYAIKIATMLAEFSNTYLQGETPADQTAIDKVLGFLQQDPLSSFSEGMTDFGTGFMAFKDTISPLDVPSEGEADELGKKTEYAIKIATMLAEFSNTYLKEEKPVDQDAIDKILGFLQQNPLSDFSEGMADFGAGFNSFAAQMGSIDLGDNEEEALASLEAKTTAAVTMAKAVADLAKQIPENNDTAWEMLMKWFLGTESNMSQFSGDMVVFAQGFNGFIAEMSKIKSEGVVEEGKKGKFSINSALQAKIDLAVSTAESLSALASALPDVDITANLINFVAEKLGADEKVIKSPMEQFTESLDGFGETMMTFIQEINSIDLSTVTPAEEGAVKDSTGTFQEKVDFMVTVASAIGDLAKNLPDPKLLENLVGLIAEKVTGEDLDLTPMEALSTNMSEFATGFNEFAKKVNELDSSQIGEIDENGVSDLQKKVNMAIAIAQLINGLQSNLPEQGVIDQLKEKITGTKFEDLSDGMDEFARGFNAFAIQVAAIETTEDMQLQVQSAINIMSTVGDFLVEVQEMDFDNKKSYLFGLFEKDSKAGTLFDALSKLCDEIVNAQGKIGGLATSTMASDLAMATTIMESLATFITGLSEGTIEFVDDDTSFANLIGYLEGLGTAIFTFNQLIHGGTYNDTGGADLSEMIAIITPLSTMLDAFSTLADESAQATGMQGIDLLFQKIPELLGIIDGIVVDEGHASSISSLLTSITGIFTDPALATITPDQFSALGTCITDLKDLLSNKGEYQIDTSDFLSDLDGATIVSTLNTFTSTISTPITNAVSTLGTFSDNFSSAGSGMISAMVSGFSTGGDSGDTMVDAVKSVCSAASGKVSTYYNTFKSRGSYLAKGLAQGVRDGKSSVVNAVAELVKAAIDKANGDLGITSPSRVFKRIGQYCDEGMAVGISQYSRVVTSAASDMSGEAVDSVGSMLGSISGLLTDDLNADPVIRPVVDLSNVSSGVRSINGMLAGRRTIDVDSTLHRAAEVSASIATTKKLQNERRMQSNTITNNADSTVNLSGNNFYIRSEQDIHRLATELASLTKRQQRGMGAPVR